jgi:outer membrane lipase/esterase
MKSTRILKSAALAAMAIAALAGCSGGGDSGDEGKVIAVRVIGDSIADSGTFGRPFTIQGAQSLIFPQLVAQAYGFGPGCSYFRFTGTTFLPSTDANCTNYAVGGGVINGAAAGLTAADPRNLNVQFNSATSTGLYSGRELLVIDGGGNDAANLVGAYLGAGSDRGAAYAAVLGTLLTPAQVGAIAAGGAAGLAGGGGEYMKALANSMADLVQKSAVDRGAKRVALLNMPGITNTPRFQAVLGGVAAASGGGTAGATARAQAEGLFKSWIVAYNTQLASRFANSPEVLVVDFYKFFEDAVTTPAALGFTNVKDTACPVTGLGSDGLPTYDFATCTEANLAAKPPAGAVAGTNWYGTWLFSDGFHPTPYAHQVFSRSLIDAIKGRGWL